MSITRESLLTINTRPAVPVECPELGGTLHVRMLSGGDINAIYSEGRDSAEAMQDIIALSLCDADGVRLMTGKGDGKALYDAHPAHVLEPIVTMVLKINRMTKEAVSEAKKD